MSEKINKPKLKHNLSLSSILGSILSLKIFKLFSQVLSSTPKEWFIEGPICGRTWKIVNHHFFSSNFKCFNNIDVLCVTKRQPKSRAKEKTSIVKIFINILPSDGRKMVMNSRIIYGTKRCSFRGHDSAEKNSWEIEGDKDGERHKENSEI